jgi:hypothetical protein
MHGFIVINDCGNFCVETAAMTEPLRHRLHDPDCHSDRRGRRATRHDPNGGYYYGRISFNF